MKSTKHQRLWKRAKPRRFEPSRLLSLIVLTCMLTSTGLGAAPAWASGNNLVSATGSATAPLASAQSDQARIQTQEVIQPEEAPALTRTSTSAFSDVSVSEEYASAVSYVVSNGMMAGTSATQFSPTEDATRGIVTIAMAQMSGEAIPTPRSLPFEDVDTSHWYSDSAAWCATNGIAVGYGNNTFGGEDSVTWEQLATILHSYARYTQVDTQISSDISNYTDVDQVSAYAVTAVSWALATGLMQAEDNQINPQGNVTRGEMALVIATFQNA